ncbi:ME53 [Mocis latipes granulovirus]|uniref:ME53 n=1 Tax=Mocis latipes granulovirus TaxID=2072024 RepID=A0A162GWE2_9BBAC|nr:ME53 [Mocis latipes granulovirus]AKR17478.1 ME53 [Mocis latipes granulovirus]
MDKRGEFLSQETRHALMFMAEFAKNAVHGHTNLLRFTPTCNKCGQTFDRIYSNTHNSYMFMVIKSWLDTDVNRVKFCCLACKNEPVEDVIELYPSFSLANLKKLMYGGVLKRFVFPFVQPSKKKCRRIGLALSDLPSVLDDLIKSKSVCEEIESVCLFSATDNEIIARDDVYHLRVDWGCDVAFSVPTQFTRQLLLNKNDGDYYLEIMSRVFEEFQPFYVFFHHNNDTSCSACVNKLCLTKKRLTPVLFCDNCGFTDPVYWVSKNVYPFWLHTYDYKRTYWKCRKKVNLMLYDIDVTI